MGSLRWGYIYTASKFEFENVHMSIASECSAVPVDHVTVKHMRVWSHLIRHVTKGDLYPQLVTFHVQQVPTVTVTFYSEGLDQ